MLPPRPPVSPFRPAGQPGYAPFLPQQRPPFESPLPAFTATFATPGTAVLGAFEPTSLGLPPFSQIAPTAPLPHPPVSSMVSRSLSATFSELTGEATPSAMLQDLVSSSDDTLVIPSSIEQFTKSVDPTSASETVSVEVAAPESSSVQLQVTVSSSQPVEATLVTMEVTPASTEAPAAQTASTTTLGSSNSSEEALRAVFGTPSP